MKPLQRFETNAGRIIYAFPVRSFPTVPHIPRCPRPAIEPMGGLRAYVTIRRTISYINSQPMFRFSIVRNSLLPWKPRRSSGLSRQGMNP